MSQWYMFHEFQPSVGSLPYAHPQKVSGDSASMAPRFTYMVHIVVGGGAGGSSSQSGNVENLHGFEEK